MNACREGELDAEAAARVDAQVDTCAACRHGLTWLRLERGWMAQRARRTPSRPALRVSALEARLARPAVPHQVPLPGTRAHWGKMLMGATAVVAFVVLSMGKVGPTSMGDEPWSLDGRAHGLSEAWCVDPSREAVDALEAAVGACLVATPR